MKVSKKALAAIASEAPAEQISQPVPVISPDGVVGTVDSEELQGAIDTGYQVATPRALTENKERNTYGRGVVNELEAGAMGFLRGSTLGLSDLGIRAFSPQLADTAAKLKKYNPDSSMAGELASFALPMLGGVKALGAAGKAAKATGLLQGLVSSGAEGLGGIATKIVGENLAGHALGSAVNMAAQSAVYQAAHNLSEDSLGDKDVTVESILAHTGQAAILGAGLGAALPVAARAVEAVAESAPVRYVADKALKQFTKFFDPDRSLQLYSGALGSGKLLQDTPVGVKFQDAVADLNKRGFYQPGKAVFDGEGKFIQVEKGALPKGQEAYERLVRGKDSVYNTINDILKQADDAIMQNPSLKTELSQFPAKAEEKILSDIFKAAEDGRLRNPDVMLDELDRVKQLFAAKNGSLAGLNDLKKGLYEGINYDVAGKAGVKIQKDLARVVKSAVEAGAEAVDPGLGSKIKDLNQLWGNLETIRKPLDVLIQKGEANVNVGGLRFRDMLTGIGGGFAGGAVGGPVGAAVGLGAGVANKMLQTDTGLLMRAQLGEKIRNLAWAESLMNKTSAEIAGSVKAFLGNTPAALASEGVAKFGAPVAYALSDTKQPGPRIKNQQEWFEETRKQLLSVASNPEAFAEHQGDESQSFADHAPGVADALIGKQLAVYSYLTQVMPKNPGMPIGIFADTWKPSDYQVQQFRKVVQVARAPLTILKDLRSGTITGDQVMAVKTLYPKIYERILENVRQEVSNPELKTTYQQRLKLGMMFEGTEPTMAPEFIAAMQTPLNKPEEPQQHARAPGGGVSLSKNTMTSTERAANR